MTPDHDTDEFPPPPEPGPAPCPTFADTLAGVARWWGENPIKDFNIRVHSLPHYLWIGINSWSYEFPVPVPADEAYATLRRLAP